MMSVKKNIEPAARPNSYADKKPRPIQAVAIHPAPKVLNVLTVDDSEMIQTMYRLVLRHYEGCRTTSACNGQEALKKLADGNFDLILLDVNMPIMGGIEFLKSFHVRGVRPPAPVIVVSTEGRDEDVHKAMALGASAYLTKPFKSSGLYEIIDSVRF